MDVVSYLMGRKKAGGEGSSGGDTLTEFLKFRNGSYLFYRCTNLVEISSSFADKITRNSSNFTSTDNMYSCCFKIETIPEMDTSNVISMPYMFNECNTITTIPKIDTKNVTDMERMFYRCYNLVSIPEIDTSKVTNMKNMFMSCYVLTTIPSLSMSNVKDAGGMFYSCRSIKTFPEMDFRNHTGTTSNIFYDCSSMQNLVVKNIKVNLQVGSNTSYGHLLTLDSLTGLIYELRDTGSSKTLTVGSANLKKLADVYVKTIDITDEMRAEDDFIDEKLPFVVCESTDEGAMLITEYVVLKNWQLK